VGVPTLSHLALVHARCSRLANHPRTGHPDAVLRFVTLLAAAVRRAPALVLAVVLVLTGAFAVLAQEVQIAAGNEGFAPDNPEILATEVIAERFGDSSEDVMQVLITGPDVISADGLTAVEAVTDAVLGSPRADLLSSNEQRPPVVSYLAPVQMALAEPPPDGEPAPQGEPVTDGEPAPEGEPEGEDPLADGTPAPPDGQDADAAPLDDDGVDSLYREALAAMPAEDASFTVGLLPEGADLDTPAADAGLMLVFVSTAELGGEGAGEDFNAIIGAQSELADAITAATLPEGFSAEPFSFPLLFSDTDSFDAELQRLFAMAFGLIILILASVFWVKPQIGYRRVGAGRRTVADVALTMATIVMAIIWVNGAAALLGPGILGLIGPMSEIAQIVPVLLIGLGVDYSIHLTSRYREEVAAGAPVDGGITGAVRTVGIALTPATMTTAVGFLTNIVNPVPALRDFGVLAAVGIVAAFVLMLTFVPSVRIMLDRRAETKGALPRAAFHSTSERILPGLMARTAVLAERVPIPTLLVTVVLGGGLGLYGLSQLETRFSTTDFISDDSPIIATFDEIVDRFGGGFGETTQVLLTGDVGDPAVHNALVDAQSDLVEVDDVSTLGDRAQAESPVTVLGQLMAPAPGGAPSPFADRAVTFGVQPDLTVSADADVSALYGAMREAAPQATERVVAFDAAGSAELARVGIQTTAGEGRAGELSAAINEVFAPVEAAGVEVVATSNPIINDVIINELQRSQVSSMAVTLIAALLLLVVSFTIQHRRPLLGVITIAPVALVVLWTFGMMAATGIPFGPITATIAAMAIGIGVPYTIHITHRYQEDRARFADPAEAIRSTVRHTGGALAGSAFTTMTGFGVLVTSSLTPFRQFGLVTAYAIGFALLASAIVLPSMLALWDRWHRRRGDGAVAAPEPPTARKPAAV
jgi:uncharacterized protein